MSLLYLDTSALAKLYVWELGSQRMLQLASASEAHQIALCAISQVELHSAIRRRQRAGDLSDDVANQAVERFELHIRNRFLRQSVSDQVIDLASDLVARHFLRAYDAVQLAGCIALRTVARESPIFVCADQQLLDAARSENLAVLDPTS